MCARVCACVCLCFGNINRFVISVNPSYSSSNQHAYIQHFPLLSYSTSPLLAPLFQNAFLPRPLPSPSTNPRPFMLLPTSLLPSSSHCWPLPDLSPHPTRSRSSSPSSPLPFTPYLLLTNPWLFHPSPPLLSLQPSPSPSFPSLVSFMIVRSLLSASTLSVSTMSPHRPSTCPARIPNPSHVLNPIWQPPTFLNFQMPITFILFQP